MEEVENQKFLVASILNYFKDCLSKEAVPSKDNESLQVACKCIANAFELDLVYDTTQRFSIGATKLDDIFNVYLEKRKSALKAAHEDRKQKAESLKSAGNEKLTNGAVSEAIALYSQAIELDAVNPVYFCNRAAAYSQNGDHEKALEDCEKALKLDPNYSKAYSRLGFACLSLKKYEEAVNAYEKAVALDPKNANLANGLKNARSKLAESSGSSASASTGPSAGGMPDLSNLSSLLGGIAGGAGGGAGGGLGALLNNPQVSEMLNNPDLMANIMNNPALMNMASSLLGGGGGGAGAAMPGGRNRNNGSGNDNGNDKP